MIEISTDSESISDQNLEEQVCKPLSITVIIIEEKDFHTCHCMKRGGRVILKFKDCKLRY